ncbi:MAG: bifunctional methylenetetrahydrofolate dehydrogenase/methenyltetrahydrofolate cyclohydrolase FolD [Bacilli bacterium]
MVKGEIISGTAISETIREELKQEILELKSNNVTPHLVVIIVGNHPASLSYVTSKKRACEAIGMEGTLIELPESTSEETLLAKIAELNNDQGVSGILVQLPLPEHIDENRIICAIAPEKDVDGFHPENVGRMMIGLPDAFLPCTPYGVMEMLRYKGIDVSGKNVVIIGRSNIVGKPVGQLFLQANATVTYTHSRTKNLKEVCREADILVVAIGRARFVDETYVKEGAVVIDVGINRDENGKLCGDVDFERAKEVASYITPVPKGVGPMTITMLLKNTVLAAKRASAR